MNVRIEQAYDGFYIRVDDEWWVFDQEDTVKRLQEVVQLINPEADVSYEEVI